MIVHTSFAQDVPTGPCPLVDAQREDSRVVEDQQGLLGAAQLVQEVRWIRLNAVLGKLKNICIRKRRTWKLTASWQKSLLKLR